MYRGRFAPTPSGPLHLGSLLTAVAGYMQARSHGGAWLIRIDDLDTPRCVPGSEAEILRQLQAHGLRWDSEPLRQSAQRDRYRQAIARLESSGTTYRCRCTREMLRNSPHQGPDGPVYAGTCRHAGHREGSLRVALPAVVVTLDERQAPLTRAPGEVGDPVVERSDGQPGYALASAVDEQALSITEIVRGADLLGASFQQEALRPLLGLPSPAHLHLPVLTDDQGRKLSKQNHAPALDGGAVSANLRRCLSWLGQDPGTEPDTESLLDAAARRWDPRRIPRLASIAI